MLTGRALVGKQLFVDTWTLCNDDGPVILSNCLFLARRTNDGGTILDVVLNKPRLARLEAAIQELLETSG
jgi:hypothetical protein